MIGSIEIIFGILAICFYSTDAGDAIGIIGGNGVKNIYYQVTPQNTTFAITRYIHTSIENYSSSVKVSIEKFTSFTQSNYNTLLKKKIPNSITIPLVDDVTKDFVQVTFKGTSNIVEILKSNDIPWHILITFTLITGFIGDSNNSAKTEISITDVDRLCDAKVIVIFGIVELNVGQKVELYEPNEDKTKLKDVTIKNINRRYMQPLIPSNPLGLPVDMSMRIKIISFITIE